MTSASRLRTGVGLRRRLLLTTLAVAVVAAAATTFAALQLTRSGGAVVARAELVAQAERVAEASPAVRSAVVEGLSALGGDRLIAVIDADGTVSGTGSDLAIPRVIVRLRAGDSVSTLVREGTTDYLVEAVPIESGGGVLLAQDAATVRSLSRIFTGPFLAAFGVGIGIAVAAAVLATRALSRPLLRLAGTARRLAAGERSLPAATTGVRELDEVAEAIAALDRALAHSESRQREFLLSISHEIRTPLTALRGYAEALADGTIQPDEVSAVGRTLHTEAMRLTTFTDDLLALARLEADDFRLDLSSTDLHALLADCADAWRATADALNVSLDVADDSERTAFHTDRLRVRQVIDGLLENALRVSPPGSRIRLAIRDVDDGVMLEVADEGPGIDPEDVPRAFERSYLRDRYRASRPVGSGLGLSISARLVNRLGGKIRAVPRAPGTTFVIHLPSTSSPG